MFVWVRLVQWFDWEMDGTACDTRWLAGLLFCGYRTTLGCRQQSRRWAQQGLAHRTAASSGSNRTNTEKTTTPIELLSSWAQSPP